MNQIAKDDIIELGNSISLAGGEGEAYINKQMALMKARETVIDEDEYSAEEFEALLIEKGLNTPCPK